MPEKKPRDSQSTPAAADAAAGSRKASEPEQNESVAKRQLFQQWVASVRPKPGAAKGASPSQANVALPANPVPALSSFETAPALLPVSSPQAAPAPVSSEPPPSAASTSPPPAGSHMVSSPPPSLMPQMTPHRESDSTQLYQKVPADLLRKARHLSTPPPPPSSSKGSPKPLTALREDPWAIADERTAVFAPPPELLASVRAAAASAGLLPADSPPSDADGEARVTAEFDLTASGSQRVAEPVTKEEHEVTKVAPAQPAADTEPTVVADTPSDAPANDEAEAEPEARRRWPWAVAALLIASALAVMAMRSQFAESRSGSPHVGAPAR